MFLTDSQLDEGIRPQRRKETSVSPCIRVFDVEDLQGDVSVDQLVQKHGGSVFKQRILALKHQPAVLVDMDVGRVQTGPGPLHRAGAAPGGRIQATRQDHVISSHDADGRRRTEQLRLSCGEKQGHELLQLQQQRNVAGNCFNAGTCSSGFISPMHHLV